MVQSLLLQKQQALFSEYPFSLNYCIISLLLCVDVTRVWMDVIVELICFVFPKCHTRILVITYPTINNQHLLDKLMVFFFPRVV